MTRKSQTQAILLAVLTVALGTVLYVQFGGIPASAPGAPSNAAAPAQAGAAARAAPGRGSASSEPVTDVKLELLQAARDTLPEAERNPFRFRTKPPPPPPPRPEGVPPPREDVAPPVPTGPPPPPPILLRFIGVIDLPSPEGRMAILSDGRGGPPVPGKEGDIIEGRYRLLRVGPDSIEMAYLDGRGRQTIRLSGQ